jgi:hypothetical protein
MDTGYDGIAEAAIRRIDHTASDGRLTHMPVDRLRSAAAAGDLRDQLRAMGATVLDETQVMEGIGRFGWAVDPEGNRFELWEPAPEALEQP